MVKGGGRHSSIALIEHSKGSIPNLYLWNSGTKVTHKEKIILCSVSVRQCVGHKALRLLR